MPSIHFTGLRETGMVGSGFMAKLAVAISAWRSIAAGGIPARPCHTWTRCLKRQPFGVLA